MHFLFNFKREVIAPSTMWKNPIAIAIRLFLSAEHNRETATRHSLSLAGNPSPSLAGAVPSSCFNGRECKPWFSRDFLRPPHSRPRYLAWTKSHFTAMASDGGYRRLPTSLCALTGSADRGRKDQGNLTALRNPKWLEGHSVRAPGSAAHYSGGGRRLRSFISSSPFQYLKLLSRCCINSGRSTKASQAANMSVMK